MFYTILLVLLVIDSIVLIAAVLMQAGQGGGMAASFGGVSSSASSFMGTRQAGNLLTKASWWCGGLFLGLAFLLSIASTRTRAPKSVLDQAFPNQPIQTAPPARSNPAVPLQEAPSPTTTQPPAGAQTKTPPTAAPKAATPPANTTPPAKKQP